MFQEISGDLILGLIGTITGVISLVIHVLKWRRERPDIEISDELMMLQYLDDEFISNLDFKINNIGERDTTIYRINVIFGPVVEVFEELRHLKAYSSLDNPTNRKDTLSFNFTKVVEYEVDGPVEYFTEREELTIVILHTHGIYTKEYLVPLKNDWEEGKLLKGELLIFTPFEK